MPSRPIRVLLPPAALAGCLLILTGAAAAAGKGNPPAAAKPGVSLPVFFEANRGQWSDSLRFAARGASSAVFLTRGGPVLAPAASGDPGAGTSVGMELPGARGWGEPEGVGPRPGTVSYLLGRDRAKWVRGAPTFGGARYRDVYPGIDLLFRAEDAAGGTDAVEFDFVAAPGSDPARIRMRFSGLSGPPRIDRRGDLVLPTAAGDLRQRRLRAYQDTGSGRRAVKASFRLGQEGEVRFALGRYDRAKPLVIDPVVVWASYVNNANTGNFSLARDSEGNLYVAGQSFGLDGSPGLPVTVGTYQLGYAGGRSDCYVGSMTPDGSALRYLTYLGGSGDESADAGRDYGPAVAVNPQGGLWVAGSTKSENFPTTPDAFQQLKPGYGTGPDSVVRPNYDVFLSRLSPDGTGLEFSTYVGGTGDLPAEINGDDFAVGIGLELIDGIMGAKVDQVTVVGTTNSTLFPTTQGVFRSTDPNAVRVGNGITSNAADVFVFKYSPFGGLRHSTYVGAPAGINRDPCTGDEISRFAAVRSIATAMALQERGDVYITGYSNSDGLFYDPIVRFPVGGDALQTVPGGGLDGWVMILDQELRDFYYSTLLGGQGDDVPAAVTVNIGGRFAVAGRTGSANFPTGGGGEFLTYRGGPTDGFVTGFNPDLTLAFSTFVGGVNSDVLEGAHITLGGTLAVVGSAGSGEIPMLDPIEQTGAVGSGFLMQFDEAGEILRSTYLSGLGSNGRALGTSTPVAVLQDGAGNLFIGGYVSQTGTFRAVQSFTFPPGPSSRVFFVARIGEGPPAAPTLLQASVLSSHQVALQWQDNSSDETAFRIERRRAGKAIFEEIASVGPNVTAAQVNGLLPQTTYEFRVRAVGGPFFSEYSNTASAATPAAGRIRVSPKKLNFGRLRPEQRRQKIVRIKNVGTGTLNINVGALSPPFAVPPGPSVLNPGQVLAVGIEAEGTSAGSFVQTLTITSDDPQRPVEQVDVRVKVR